MENYSFHKSISSTSTLPPPCLIFFWNSPLRFVYITGQQINKVSKQILKGCLSSQLDVANQNKTKTVAPHITYLMRSLELLLTIFPIFLVCLQMSSIFVFIFTLHLHSLSCINFAVLQKPCQGNFGKVQRSHESRFSGSVKDR